MKTCKVLQHKRLNTVSKLFGVHFPFRIEPMIYHLAGSLCHDYQGGYWQFVMIDSAGFFMHPDSDARFEVSCPNQYSDTVSAEAFGLITCLYSYSALSFDGADYSQRCSEQYHLIREYALSHPEAAQILAAID